MKFNLRSECELFLVALAFFTRIPVPAWVDFSSDRLQHASRYYALVGCLVGILTAIVYFFCHLYLSTSVSVLLSMCFSVYLTGAFHEDGFADCCDGFGGGYTIEQTLSIMKDPRVGSYGVIGLILILLLKWQLLIELDSQIIIGLIIGHIVVESLAGSLIFSLPYVRSSDSKVGSYAVCGSKTDISVLSVSTFVLLSMLLPPLQLFLLLIFVLLMRVISIRYLKKTLEGYTGDCLGAVQQMSEIVLYIFLILTI